MTPPSPMVSKASLLHLCLPDLLGDSGDGFRLGYS